ncbi:MAG: tRNA lysidine(34) synthetase TilS [Solirubrobacteraceae bacterium]
MLDAVRAAVDSPVVVLYSGGRDSTCLLHASVEVLGVQVVSALHVNYGLRDCADEDERHCAAVCRQLGVGLDVHRTGQREGGNLQAWAREERYREASRLAAARDALVAVGHTSDDQVETILYRLISSPSRRAVLGIRVRDGVVVRPLLSVSRAETTAYCDQHGLSWRDDSSNESDAYVRNRIRHSLVPLLAELHPGASANLLELAARLRAEGEVLDELVESELRGSGSISLKKLRELPPALAALVVQRLADEALGAPAAGVARRAPEVLALSDRGTVTLDLGHNLRAIAEYGAVRVAIAQPERVKDRMEPYPAPPPTALSVPGEADFDGGRVVCELVEPVREQGVLDRDSLGDELVVRSWLPGDRMRPLGLNGSKSLQDLFTARRVPREQRGQVAVVQARDGEIAWVEGVATSELFKVTAATTRAVRLSVRPR